MADAQAPATFRPGGILSGHVFAVDEHWVSHRHPYGNHFRVPRAAVETVIVDAAGRTQGILKLIGHGSTLASVRMLRAWAEQTQAWLMEQLHP